MTKETISKVLHAVHSARIKRKDDLAGERDRFSLFGLFNELTNANYNERFHSDMIAWLLGRKSNHNNHNHNLGNVPMRLFVQLLNSAFGKECISEHSFDDATVGCETHGKIDILITTKNDTECIIIENKIKDASDQPEQLKRYYNRMKETHTVKAIVYLTPDGHSPDEEYSMGDEKDNIKPLLINLPSYSPHEPNLSTGVVDAIISSGSIDNLDISSLLRQYGLFLKKIRGDYMIDLVAADFIESITKDGVIDKDLFDNACYIKTMDWVPYIDKQIYNDLQNRIAKPPDTIRFGKGDTGSVDLTFKIKNDEPFGIDLATKGEEEEDWGATRTIKLFYRKKNGDATESKDNFKAIKNTLKPIADKARCCFDIIEDEVYTLYFGGAAGIQYVGNEETFYNLVIDILDALINIASETK